MKSLLRSAFRRYGLAVASYVVVLGLQNLLLYFSIRISFTIPIIASLIAVSWYGGRGPGLLLAVLFQATTIYSNPIAPGNTLTQAAIAHASTLALLVFIVFLISGRRAVENRIKESGERYRQLFDNNPFPMWVFDLKTLKFLAVNEAAIYYYGYTRKEFLTMTIAEIRPEPEIPALIGHLEKPGEKLAPATFWKHQKKDGSIIDVEITSHELSFDGRPARLVLAMDITERRNLEDQLRQSQKLESIGRLAGGIAHDFNNMLTAINGYSDLALRQLPDDHPVRKHIEEVKKAGERSAMLTNQLLAFSRRQILRPEKVKVNDVINDTSNMLKRVIGEDVELVTSLNPATGTIRFDPGQLSQILMNLAINARDAMPGGGKLTIETANVFIDANYATTHLGVLPGPYVVLSISDTGVGMPPEIKERIYEPFFTTKEIGKGTGLGLATVYGIVRQSGGGIFVYSEVEHGTTFKILLPRVVEDAEKQEPRPRLGTLARGTETILLVEDEESVRALSRQLLDACGYNVIEARDGVEALEALERSKSDIALLITDVVMPRMGGRELAEKLRESRPDLPVLFASGYTDDAIVRHGVLETNVNFIQKPFTLEDVARKVRELLDAKQQG